MAINKKNLSETDIRNKFIRPAIVEAGWDSMTGMREEVSFTDGRVIVDGKVIERGNQKRADYILYHQSNLPIAIVEAKDNKHGVGQGIQQALDYAQILDVPFAYSSNGDAFLEHDRTRSAPPIERDLALNGFPAPDELWQRYLAAKNFTAEQERIVTQPYYDAGLDRRPRYYQINAINRTIEAIAKSRNRLLLVMATGTGKTYTAFQIIWRLWKAKAKKRILFLADRNILLDQARVNDFRPFGNAMTKITNRQIDTSYEIYLSLYQAVTGTEEEQNIYKQFSRNFFDLVIVDECHRGSAEEDSAWRAILDYFSAATHIGLTATPRQSAESSNIDYFGDPIYTYSLRQGIADGFLAPYKVVRVDLNIDQGWRPAPGERDRKGNLIPNRLYTWQDFDRTVEVDERTRLVAQKITEYLHATDRYQKTIVFCQNSDHAARMRQMLVNENADLVAEDRRYIMQITSSNPEGVKELDNFIQPDQRYPVIAVTSKLLSTGVDAQTCRLVVLDKTINSMTEFKQIIGRGTRLNEYYGKHYFTIMDFRQATRLFEDPAFDGPAIEVHEVGQSQSPVPPSEGKANTKPAELAYAPGADQPRRYVLDDKAVYVADEQIFYYDEHGKRVEVAVKAQVRELVTREFPALQDFVARWSGAATKQEVLEDLERLGVSIALLAQAFGPGHDPFDRIAHAAYDEPLLTRQQRADQARSASVYLAAPSPHARSILDALLDHYAATEELIDLSDLKLLSVPSLASRGTKMELVGAFGGADSYRNAMRELQVVLYGGRL